MTGTAARLIIHSMRNAAKYFDDGKDKYGRTPAENKALEEGYAWAEKEGSEYWKAVFSGLKGEAAQRAAIENWDLA